MNWQPQIRIFALSHRVLVVAKTRIEGAWCAYCDAVPGECHADEASEVLRLGGKIPADVARILFPEFIDLPYAP